MVQLNHYTLITGHGRLTDRSEVADDVIEALRPIVVNDGGDLPGGLGLVVTPSESAGGWVFTVYHASTPLVTCGLAITPEAAGEVWPCLLEVGKVTGLPILPRQPPVPWLSVAILPGLNLFGMEMWEWLGDLERCIAWTLIDASVCVGSAMSLVGHRPRATGASNRCNPPRGTQVLDGFLAPR